MLRRNAWELCDALHAWGLSDHVRSVTSVPSETGALSGNKPHRNLRVTSFSPTSHSVCDGGPAPSWPDFPSSAPSPCVPRPPRHLTWTALSWERLWLPRRSVSQWGAQPEMVNQPRLSPYTASCFKLSGLCLLTHCVLYPHAANICS